MRLLFSVLLVVLMSCGCADHDLPLPGKERSGFVAAWLAADPPFNELGQSLAAPSLERGETDAIYREATKAASLKRHA